MPRGRAAKFELQRETILQRAAELFATRGYTGTSMNELARAVGISKALLYHYYADKYQLLCAIAEGHIDRLLALSTALVKAHPDGAKRLRPLIDGIVAEYAQARYHHQVLVQDIKYLSPVDRRRIRRKEGKVVAIFAAAIAAANPALAARNITKPLTMLLFGMVNWLFTWFRSDGRLGYSDISVLVGDFVSGGLAEVERRTDGPA
jgi:AcrR family transcriptional regulator